MKFTVTDDLGRIWRTGSCPEWVLSLQAGPGQTVHKGEYTDDKFYFDLKAQAFYPIPERPQGLQIWDDVSNTWRADLIAECEAALARIEARRVAITAAPIAHADLLVDADATAQDNIRSKLLEIQQCADLGLPMDVELLVWRDANNVTHSFESPQAYGQWLGQLAVAITQRGTAAYVWAWANKVDVEAAVAAYDVAALAALPTPFKPVSTAL